VASSTAYLFVSDRRQVEGVSSLLSVHPDRPESTGHLF
jgi:hypothetical protein